MKSIDAVEEEIIQEFNQFDSIDEKYTHLFRLGRELPELDGRYKTDENLVKGCQSDLWFHFSVRRNRIFLEADSDSMVIKGIAALLIRIINGRKPEEVEQIGMDFIDQMQIWKLASQRNNGLMAMLDHIKNQVKNFTKKNVDKEADETHL